MTMRAPFRRPPTPAVTAGVTTALTLLASALPALAQGYVQIPQVTVTATRLGDGITGASTSVISSEDIAQAPGQTLQDVIATIPGVQMRSLYGGVNGAQSSVDLRGFGAFGTSNTLVLINGRRLNDVDMAGVDFAAIPRHAIERIEVTRGNSGAVLYGDNAVGGVINIVTKNGAHAPNGGRIEAGFGSFNQREGNATLNAASGAWSMSAYGNAINSDGWRANNALRQRNGMAEARYTGERFTAFLNLSADDQHLGLPSERQISSLINQYYTDPRGTRTPFDYADKQGLNATTGFTTKLWNGGELIVDGGVRDKKQQAGFFSPFTEAYVDTHLMTWSITPRLRITDPFLGLRSTILTGIDYYDASYDSTRSQFANTAPIHIYNLRQQTVAAYWQQTVGIFEGTDLSYGARLQQHHLDARDTFNPAAPGAFDTQSIPLDTRETNHALHVGLEHRLDERFTVFARAARAFRTPNVDERLVTGPAFDAFFMPIPQNFILRTQTSYDFEAGLRVRMGALGLQTSLYDMYLTNEIHFDPVNFYNYNLDPTRRYGSETNATYRVSDSVVLKGSFAYTRAVFRDGPFAGKDVPLVSRYTGSLGASWNVWQKYLVLDTTARFFSARRLDNDQANVQPEIPAQGLLDLKLSGEVDRFFWSAAVNNVFDTQYFDYGVASAFTPGRYNVYPLPGRSFVVKAGMTF
jgi:iron complex outermembrane receptor protein